MIHLTTHKNSDEYKNGKHLYEIYLIEQEWSLLKNLIQVLEPFGEAIQYLDDSYYSIHSLIYRVIKKLKEMFEPIIINMDDSSIEDEKDAFDDDEEPTNEEQIMLNNFVNTTDLLNE
ncbi:9664_t:CDS:1, partial [Cetraspora pellucida]